MEQYVWYAFSGTDSVLENGKDDARILVIQGQKLREPEGTDSVIVLDFCDECMDGFPFLQCESTKDRTDLRWCPAHEGSQLSNCPETMGEQECQEPSKLGIFLRPYHKTLQDVVNGNDTSHYLLLLRKSNGGHACTVRYQVCAYIFLVMN